MPWGFPLPTHSLTHTLILTDKLVFNNQFTYVGGGFFLDYQDVPPQGDCPQSRYTGSTTSTRRTANGPDTACGTSSPLINARRASRAGRSTATYQTVRSPGKPRRTAPTS